MTRARSLSRLANSTVFTVSDTNRVGIGSTQPDVKLDVGGDMNVSGTLTYEDVTNVETTGIVTAAQLVVTGVGATFAGISTFLGNIEVGDKIIHNGDTNTAIRFPAADTFTVETAGSERLRVTSAGNFGVGTTPEEIFHVKASSETVSSRDGVLFESSSSLAADTGLPLVFTSHIGNAANYGVASIAGRKENATSGNGAGYLQFGTGSSGGAIAEKMRITGIGSVGIGTDDPKTLLDISNSSGTGTQMMFHDSSTGYELGDGVRVGYNGSGAQIWNFENTYIRFATTNVERIRIDPDGRFLKGITSGRDNFANNASGAEVDFQIEGTNFPTSSLSLVRNSNDANDCSLVIGKTRATSVGGNTVVQAGDDLGDITFCGADGTSLQHGANIVAEVQSGVGNDDMPTDLIFKTNGGTTSTTERLRITSAGIVTVTSGGSLGIPAVPGANTNADMSVLFQSTTGLIDGGSGLVYNPAEDALKVNGNTVSSQEFRGSGDDVKLTAANSSSTSFFFIDGGVPKIQMASDKAIQFSGSIGEIGNVTGFQATNTAASANTDFGIRATTIRFATGNSERCRVTDSGFMPDSNDARDLGSTSLRWANVFTADLQLSNESKKDTGGNDVDGTWGDYTIQEGENDLFLLNKRNGKKFKFMLQEVS